MDTDPPRRLGLDPSQLLAWSCREGITVPQSVKDVRLSKGQITNYTQHANHLTEEAIQESSLVRIELHEVCPTLLEMYLDAIFGDILMT